ncbi:MAG TPA: hypothetical protein VNT23_03285 [Gaiellaceae bacterium]|nr:hypothetical protein [Gaiellaceae bacterium]
MRRIVDPAAEFLPTVERVFGPARVLDGGRAVQVGDLKLRLDAGERELWIVRTPALGLEDWVGMVEIEGDLARAVREAKERLDG